MTKFESVGNRYGGELDCGLRLTQDAYICDNGLEYTAAAVDKNDNEHQVYWLIKCHDTQGDESNACVWDDYRLYSLYQ